MFYLKKIKKSWLASCEVWTHDPWFTRPVLYHWAKEATDSVAILTACNTCGRFLAQTLHCHHREKVKPWSKMTLCQHRYEIFLYCSLFGSISLYFHTHFNGNDIYHLRLLWVIFGGSPDKTINRDYFKLMMIAQRER
jgi:hypothetical protein